MAWRKDREDSESFEGYLKNVCCSPQKGESWQGGLLIARRIGKPNWAGKVPAIG